jgi:hypothetical protein
MIKKLNRYEFNRLNDGRQMDQLYNKIEEIIDVVNTITEKDRMLRPGGSAYDLIEVGKAMKRKKSHEI